MNKKDYLVVGFNESRQFAKKLSKKLRVSYLEIIEKRFPDNESYLRFPKNVKGKKLIFVISLNNPDEKIVKLIFSLSTGKDLGAKKQYLVVPYMPYLRQDKRFNQGECISGKAFGELFNNSIDKLYTVDPHLHRFKGLGEVFNCASSNIKGINTISDYILKNFNDAVIIGPDIESLQWVSKLSEKTGFEKVIMLKKRFSSHKVKITTDKSAMKKIEKHKQIIVFDDIISSGTTMINIVKKLKRHGLRNINIICVHGIFANNSYERLKKLGVNKIISANTILHKSNRINLAIDIAEQLKKDFKM
ncbi:MAG: ribose-phosphate diphosphokinase [Candidatus Woesearchaeota archaeon]